MGRDVTLERRIQELCAEAVTAENPDALMPTINELRNLLQEHNDELKLMLSDYPFLLDDLGKRAA